MILEVSKKQAEFDQLQARNLGVEIYQIANAVSKYTAYYSGDEDFTPETEYTTLDFLKDADGDDVDGCTDGDSSTPSISFLDCDLFTSDTTSFGDLGFTITVEQTTSTDDDGNEDVYLTSKIVFDTLTKKINGWSTSTVEYREAKSLSGLAALVASGATTVGSNDPSTLSTVATIGYCLTDSISYCDSADIGHIVAITTDDASTQLWLRVDHGNTMQNILEFGDSVTGTDSNGFSLRQIQSVARIYNDEIGSGLNSALILGNDGEVYNSSSLNSALTTAGVVVDADMLLYKELIVLSDASIEGDLEVFGDASIGRDLTVELDSLVKGDSVIEQELYTEGNAYLQDNVEITNDLSVGQNTELSGTLTVDLATTLNSTLTVSGDVTAPIIYDIDDSNYYVDPSSSSNLSSVIIDTEAELPSDTYITLNGTKRLLSSLLGTYVHMYSAQVQDGDTIDKPTCDVDGVEKVILTPIVTAVRLYEGNDSTYPASGALYSYAESNGDSWTINLGSQYDGESYSDDTYALASAYCSYEIR
ncbi:hypothetical protein [Psychromonas sp. SP041]|uniref:hypothetical protein n=1 Tax=Psychromonas sp. SP041 TaxID=1365007 RepID=UPI001F0EF4B2|nr:hypothetical protein [Psychromonas sp. SP041]